MKRLEKKIIRTYKEGIKSIKRKGSNFGWYSSKDAKISFTVYRVSGGPYIINTIINRRTKTVIINNLLEKIKKKINQEDS